MTGGELKIELAPVGTIVPYNETMDAIGQGILQGDITSTVYFTGRSKAFSLLGDLIAGYDRPEQIGMFCYLGGGRELLQELYDRYTGGTVQVVGCSTPAREAFVAKVPIRSVEDFRGKKVRAPRAWPRRSSSAPGRPSSCCPRPRPSPASTRAWWTPPTSRPTP
jgi:TRAP-type mannitol/chloroaromatic compound transport system substrate-binding protein